MPTRIFRDREYTLLYISRIIAVCEEYAILCYQDVDQYVIDLSDGILKNAGL